MRARVELSQRIREIEFTEAVKRRLIDDDEGRGRGRQGACSARSKRSTGCSIRRTRSSKLKEEDRKNILRQIKELKLKLKAMTDTLEQAPDELKQTLDTILRGE